MHGKRTLHKVSIASSFILFSAMIAGIVPVRAAGRPELLVTWQASKSYVPSFYSGKILPNQASQVTASVEAFTPQGQVINLSRQQIYWYLNDVLINGGIGAQRATFQPFGQAPSAETLRVEVPNYPGGLLIREINFPLITPVAVIESSYPQGQFHDIPISMKALPYFFNATSSAPLVFSWSVNGETVVSAENPQSLQISLPQSTPSGFAVNINLTIRNTSDSMTAEAASNLAYQRQL
jgi:hypothetical protein